MRTVDSDIAEICHHVSDFRYSPRCSYCNQIFIGLTVLKNLSPSCSLSQKRKKSKSVLSRNKTKSRTIVFLTLKKKDKISYKSRSNRNKIGIPKKVEIFISSVYKPLLIIQINKIKNHSYTPSLTLNSLQLIKFMYAYSY